MEFPGVLRIFKVEEVKISCQFGRKRKSKTGFLQTGYLPVLPLHSFVGGASSKAISRGVLCSLSHVFVVSDFSNPAVYIANV